MVENFNRRYSVPISINQINSYFNMDSASNPMCKNNWWNTRNKNASKCQVQSLNLSLFSMLFKVFERKVCSFYFILCCQHLEVVRTKPATDGTLESGMFLSDKFKVLTSVSYFIQSTFIFEKKSLFLLFYTLLFNILRR